MTDQQTSTAIHLVITVVDRGRSEKVVSVCTEAGIPLHSVSLGHGTARTEMLDLLGLGETSKDIVFSFAPEYAVNPLLNQLADRLKMRYPGKGIAFALPLSSVSGRMYRALTETEPSDTERMITDMSCSGKYELVVALTNRGYTDLIMEAARQVGAPGGTVLNTRGLGTEEVEQFLGISIQAEKELVFLVVPSEKRQDIMQAIVQEAGLKTPAKGIVLSLPVSHAIGLA
ncbi:MAG: P-II family nitrogen regulator [Oscillospiraceae bacterium]|nr:P-II family nitrogen regulator [Oscillospiraceae bacterium]